MRLGEAYVNVRADLKPYARDLQAGLKATTAAFEKQLNKSLGQRFGRNISEGAREELVSGAKSIAQEVERTLGDASDGAERRLRTSSRRGTSDGVRGGLREGLDKSKDFFTLFGSALASALDDGISALPLEVKAAISAGLILATPAIIAQLGAAVAAGTALGVAALGVALASQLSPVQEAFQESLERARNAATQAAGPLITPLINALEFFAARVEQVIGPRLQDLFSAIAPGLEDLLTGLIAGVDVFLGELTASGLDLNQLLSDLGDIAGRLIGLFGAALRIIVGSGEEGRIALKDLATILEVVVLGTAGLVRIVTELYGGLRLITALLQGDLTGVANSLYQRQLDQAQGGIFNLSQNYAGLTTATDEQTRAFKDQQKAAEDARKAIDDVVQANNDLITNQIDQEESWDRLKEGIEENGRTLDINTEKGRENARNVQRYLSDVKTELQGRVDAGEITAAEAEEQFAREAAAAEKLFGTTVKGRAQFDALYQKMIEVTLLSFDPSGWTAAFYKIGTAVQTAISRIKELQQVAAKAGVSTDIKVTGGTQLMADGGRVTQPTSAILGENYRPEVVLPETKPARAAQILANSPLGGMLSGGPTTVIAYFDGEPFQARIVRTVSTVNQRNARTTTQVPRSI